VFCVFNGYAILWVSFMVPYRYERQGVQVKYRCNKIVAIYPGRYRVSM